MLTDVLKCKDQQVLVVKTLKLKLTKDVVLAMTKHTEPVNGKPMQSQVCGVRKAQNWLKQQAVELVNPYLDVEESNRDESLVSFFINEGYGKSNTLTVKNQVYIAITSDKKVGLVDRDGLRELQKNSQVEARDCVTVTFDNLMDFECCGFLDAEFDEVLREKYKRRESLGGFIGEKLQTTKKNTDTVIVQELFDAFCEENGLNIDKLDFFNVLVDIFGNGAFVMVDNKKCIKGFRWKNDAAQ